MYNHSNQYRCTIIRGKSQSEIDNMLPAYANVLDDICPCSLKRSRSVLMKNFQYIYHQIKEQRKLLIIIELR